MARKIIGVKVCYYSMDDNCGEWVESIGVTNGRH